MSIIIKGLDMPKNCYHCPAHNHWNTGIKCVILNRLTEDRPSDCPLIEIPTPHGRLIDESKMEFYYMERWTYTEDGIIKDRTRHYRDEDVLKTPTILEAEE